ncbi:putative Iron-containing alcohol dehydrogenase [Candidatus Terasakiella magnetica]|uniref:Putative Iron-containing alcohol dehydrogenase n=1 Tax=Candidatus Terasakiella magnetica TaxID=1867952 RepID=A0A1C3RG59_9PROT|nr:phosphonoacetaldehyde reductase [Candidatus Terasakiella magnetica]SCA56270.1 putative Iron-containing alcohol dehydrogenase [Candidatus Terasakiella magnetica]
MALSQKQFTWDGLGEHIGEKDGTVFVVTGRHSFYASGAAEKLEKVLAGKSVVYFNEFNPNPQLAEIQSGVEKYRICKPSTLIAIGGGSAIDVAKGIKLLAEVPDAHFEKALSDASAYDLHNHDVEFFAIPTTFGTGSESTSFATVYVKEKKYSLLSPACLPTGYLLDGYLGVSASQYIKASCGIDALCQAIESFWAKGANEESRRYALEAISLIMPSLPIFVCEESDVAVLDKMALGSNYAGRAINISKTTAPHAISYAITQKYGIEHGQAVFLTLPYFLRKNYILDQSGIMRQLLGVLNCRSIQEADEKLISLSSTIGLKSKLSEIQTINEHDVRSIASQVNLERLGNHPFDVTMSDIEEALLFG